MADPLSVASGVAGLVSLGLTLCGGLHNYFSAVRDRHQEIEAAGKDIALLQLNLSIIQSSTLKLAHRHALSANGVNQGLASCESQLVNLQQMMLDLTKDEGLTDIKAKLRKQIKIARYPFDQKKLFQLQAQLSKVNATLSDFVQNFNLDINIGISEDLRVLKNHTNANDRITHNLLDSIARRLDSISPAVQCTQMEVLTVSRQVQETLNHLTTSSYISDVAKSRYLQNSQKEGKMIESLIHPKCTCSCQPSRSFRQKSLYYDKFWANLGFAKENHKQHSHRPGCIFFRQSLQVSKTTLTYLGSRYWCSRILSLSLIRDYPTGAYSLAFGIQSFNIVESSPAFQALYNLQEKYFMSQNDGRFDIIEETSIMIKNLRNIYRTGSASPRDIDSNGNNISHICLKFYLGGLTLFRSFGGLSFDKIVESIRLLLFYMFEIGVSIAAPGLQHRTIFELLLGPSIASKMLPRIYDLITSLDTSFHTEDIAHGQSIYHAVEEVEQLQFWSECPEIAEDFGFNDIFRAVMQRDRIKLEALMVGDNLLPGILETDMYGRNIFHACITWPEGLGLLLQCHQAVHLSYDNAPNTTSPLGLAIGLSGLVCVHSQRWELFQNCCCSDAVQLILEADCRVPIERLVPRYLKYSSMRVRKLLFKHLENRRRRLRDLSLTLLPLEVIDRYNVSVDCLPDAAADFLWRELQSSSDKLTSKGFEISRGLQPSHSRGDFGGLFERILSPEVCSLADEFGLRPSDEGCLLPLIARVLFSAFAEHHAKSLEVDIFYVDWLLNHDHLQQRYAIGGFHISALHHLGVRMSAAIVVLIDSYLCPTGNQPYFPSREAIKLIRKICTSKLQSDLPCPCTSGAFNRPLPYLLTVFVSIVPPKRPRWLSYLLEARQYTNIIKWVVPDVDTSYLAKCTIHIITMDILGIRHIGPCARNLSMMAMQDFLDEEEWMELLAEDSFLLQRLDDLDEEFEREFQIRNEPLADFLGGYYTGRMREVLSEMDSPPTDNYRRGLLAAGVVLAEEEEISSSHSLGK